MDYKKMVDLNQQFAKVWRTGIKIIGVGEYNPDDFLEMNATAITDLLARAEEAEARAEKAERERDAAVKLIDWIYSEVCISVEHDMRQHLDRLKDKIEQWIEEGVETDDIEDCEEDVSAYKVFMDKAIKLWKEGKE